MPDGGRHGGKIIALSAAVMVAAAIAATFALVSPGAGHGGAARASETRAKHGSASSPGRPVLRVVSMLPSDRAARVNGSGPIEVAFSARLAASSPLPTLTPPVRGRWQQVGTAMVFTPAAGFAPLTKVTVRIPAGQAGVRSAAGALLARPLAWHFSTRSYSQLRLSELLSQLGYLPISWTPAASGHLAGPEGTAGGGPASPASLAYSPPAGKFTWDKGYPSMLTSQWRPGAPNPVATGALMAFESQHGMPADGVASPALWAALFRTAARRQGNRAGYTYAIASQSLPEMLTIWHDGKVVMRSLANTGIPVAPTADGTFPVYLRYRFQIMSGINPDGSHYSDPVSFVAYFNGGDAVHYFPRGSYGYQQSLGCVELPLSSAAQAWPYLTYGSLVTVAS